MSQADLQTVLSHLPRLRPEELREVGRVVRERLANGAACQGDDQEAFLRALKGAGLISKINRRSASGRPEFTPIPVRGEPVSETIIEERR